MDNDVGRPLPKCLGRHRQWQRQQHGDGGRNRPDGSHVIPRWRRSPKLAADLTFAAEAPKMSATPYWDVWPGPRFAVRNLRATRRLDRRPGVGGDFAVATGISLLASSMRPAVCVRPTSGRARDLVDSPAVPFRRAPIAPTPTAAPAQSIGAGAIRRSRAGRHQRRAWRRTTRRTPRMARRRHRCCYPLDRRGSGRPIRTRPPRPFTTSSPPPFASCRRAACSASCCVLNVCCSPVTCQPPPLFGPTVTLAMVASYSLSSDDSGSMLSDSSIAPRCAGGRSPFSRRSRSTSPCASSASRHRGESQSTSDGSDVPRSSGPSAELRRPSSWHVASE